MHRGARAAGHHHRWPCDLVGALLCLVQAAWAEGPLGHGVPAVADPVEGRIVGP